MAIGLLLITHNEIGDALLKTAINTFGGECPLSAATLAVTNGSDPEQLRLHARQLIGRLDSGMGVLVLTDIYGSTPGNIATSLTDNCAVSVLAGVNLPMLLKIFNYSQLDLLSLMEKALHGGQESIIMCHLP